MMTVADLVDRLSVYQSDLVCNPWCDDDMVAGLDVDGAAAIRRQALMDYLLVRDSARVLVVAEAAGYQGCRFTGIPLTCERMLLGRHRRVDAMAVFGMERMSETVRTSVVTPSMSAARVNGGFIEPTDTVVWEGLLDAGYRAEETVLWNVFPFHPYRVNHQLSNRTPTNDELAVGGQYMAMVMNLFSFERVFAVGRKSAEVLATMGIDSIALRHPANGGVPEFRKGLMRFCQ